MYDWLEEKELKKKEDERLLFRTVRHGRFLYVFLIHTNVVNTKTCCISTKQKKISFVKSMKPSFSFFNPLF